MTMTIWTALFGALCFGCGGAFIWFAKVKLQSLVIDANTLSAKLHAQADKIKAAV
jgi:hypothetical protein